MKSYVQLVRHNGNRDLFNVVEMSIASLASGVPLHIHAEGLRGTGKTTILRAAKELLPPILKIKNCIYNCHPARPHCPEHKYLSAEEIVKIGTEIVPCPFLEISHAAKIGTVVGSIDLGKLTNRLEPSAALLPGTLPQAHRGVIFIDEINRLADTSPELADILLDVMGTKPGRIQIEETGLAIVELPISVTIWAASNPDEDPGPLVRIRKQLADRFDFGISMGRPDDYHAVLNILEQAKIAQNNNSNLNHSTIENINNIIIDDYMRSIIAKIYIDFNLESLRAAEAMKIAACLSAALTGRNNVEISDIVKVVPLVLTHRTDKETIASILQYLQCLKMNKQSVDIKNSFPQLPNEVSSDEHKKISWWSSFLALLSSILSFLNKFRPIQNRSNGTGKQQKFQSAANMKALDPAKTKLIAPPKKALPLKEMSVEEMINNEDKKL